MGYFFFFKGQLNSDACVKQLLFATAASLLISKLIGITKEDEGKQDPIQRDFNNTTNTESITVHVWNGVKHTTRKYWLTTEG